MEAAFHEAVGYIEKNVEASNFIFEAFLDIEGAFNNVKLDYIYNVIHAFGISSIVMNELMEC